MNLWREKLEKKIPVRVVTKIKCLKIIFFVYDSVRMYMCGPVRKSMLRPKVNVRYHSSITVLIFGTGSLHDPEVD